jgi:hypothetical protein
MGQASSRLFRASSRSGEKAAAFSGLTSAIGVLASARVYEEPLLTWDVETTKLGSLPAPKLSVEETKQVSDIEAFVDMEIGKLQRDDGNLAKKVLRKHRADALQSQSWRGYDSIHLIPEGLRCETKCREYFVSRAAYDRVANMLKRHTITDDWNGLFDADLDKPLSLRLRMVGASWIYDQTLCTRKPRKSHWPQKAAFILDANIPPTENPPPNS